METMTSQLNKKALKREKEILLYMKEAQTDSFREELTRLYFMNSLNMNSTKN